MKIAKVCPYDFSRPGGVKNHIESLSKHLRLLGHEVIIIAPHPNVSQNNVSHFGKNRSINFGGTKIDLNIAVGEDRRALKAFIKNQQFDIIHFHTFWNPVLPFQVRKGSSARHVATFHDTPKNKFVGKTIMPLAARGIFNLMDAIISVSETQAAYINRFSKREITIVPNGIDLETYNQPVEPIEKYQDRKFNLLFLGRLEPRKGLIYALKSFKALKKENDDLRLLIAGDGDERALAERFITENDLKDVELLGFVTEDEKLRLLKTADLYLAPAIYGESFGIVLLEAMAMGTPVSGFANEGYLNVLTKSQQRYFAKPKDGAGLTECIRALINDKEALQSQMVTGKEVVRKYDWKVLVKKIEDIYNG